MGMRAQGVRVHASEGASKRGCVHEGARKREARGRAHAGVGWVRRSP